MGSPPTAASSRPTPTGIRLDDGFSTEVVFAAAPNIGFWEKIVTPPGLDGGDPVITTTMHNITYRTKAPRKLVEMTEFSMRVAYDPALYNSAFALLNVQTTVTVFFPDGLKLAFYGFLRSLKPDGLEEGKQPEMEAMVVPTNQDPNDGSEQPAVMTDVSGT